MTNDKGKKVLRKLNYFYKNEIPVHFKLETGEFRNGKILDLSKEKMTLVLKEFVMGTVPFLLENINENSITKFTKLNMKEENA